MESKHGNTRSTCSLGHSHRSKLEHAVCAIIQLRQKAGELELLQVEDHVLISGWYRYVPDFKCRDLKTGEVFWIEAKGYANDRWPSTKRGWKHAGPGVLEVWGGSHARPTLMETIIPRQTHEDAPQSIGHGCLPTCLSCKSKAETESK